MGDAPVIRDDEDRILAIELDAGEARLLRDHWSAERLMLVLGQIKDVDLAVVGDCGKDSGRIRRPANISDGVAQIKR